ncbi:hypothetical protein J4229_02545 [Candidatus Pacearchaeota archaeon]|nr:hypothetical protein [Candidatus Pacearchaeota archaeon]
MAAINRNERWIYNGSSPFYELENLEARVAAPREFDEAVVEKNLDKIRESMEAELCGESVNGNAGCWNRSLCFAGNFYYNRDSGEISRFSNHKYKLDDITYGNNVFGYGTIRFASVDKKGSLIVGAWLGLDGKISCVAVTPKARANLIATAHKYNTLHLGGNGVKRAS